MNNIAYQKQVLASAVNRSADWFYWIAGLSVVNSFIALFTKMGFGFAISLGIVDVANYLITNKIFAMAFTLVAAGIFAAFGWFARSGNIPVFIIGVVLYTLDCLIEIMGKQWIGIALHAYVLYILFNGVKYSAAFKKAIAQEAADQRQQRITNAASGQP